MWPIKLGVASDIHLGHRTNSTRSIIENMMKYLFGNPATKELNILCFAGDVFDGLLNLPQEDVWEIEMWVAYSLRFCKEHNISLRILYGTKSHDWDQGRIFEIVNKVAGIGADLKYVDDLSIEYIEPYGITVLYVPDDLEGGPDKTLSRIHSLLEAKQLKQVDFAMMHGQFEFQLPEHVKAPKHNSAEYLKIVKYLIWIGHVHTYSNFDRIFAQGSFDRLGQGQEEAKGYLRAVVHENGNYEMTFVENEGAKKYLTVDVIGLPVDESIAKIDKVVDGLPDDSYIRVHGQSGHPVITNMLEMVRRHPTHHWSAKEEKSKEIETYEEGFSEENSFVSINISKDNITPMLLDRLVKRGASSQVFMVAERVLGEEILNVR